MSGEDTLLLTAAVSSLFALMSDTSGPCLNPQATADVLGSRHRQDEVALG